MREELRFAMEDSGGLCVMTFGVDQMLKLCVGSLDMKQMVKSIALFCTIMYQSGNVVQVFGSDVCDTSTPDEYTYESISDYICVTYVYSKVSEKSNCS